MQIHKLRLRDYRGCMDDGFEGIINVRARQASELYNMVFVTHRLMDRTNRENYLNELAGDPIP